jgi:AcrR family transcriptional regulator
MDEVASRARTSKRSLYAHFENKEKLFLAVIELVRGLFLSRLKVPGAYSSKPAEALVTFCGRYLETLFYEPSIQMVRVSTAEVERFPEQARQYFDVLFTQVHTRLAEYLRTTFKIPPNAAAEAANRLLAQVLFPRLSRALFGIDPLAKKYDREDIAPDFDLKPIRKAVAELLVGMPER